MSSSLSWYPVIQQEEHYLGYDAKFALRKRYGEPINVQLGCIDLDYLQGLADSGRDELAADIRQIIKAVNKHKEIILKEEW